MFNLELLNMFLLGLLFRYLPDSLERVELAIYAMCLTTSGPKYDFKCCREEVLLAQFFRFWIGGFFLVTCRGLGQESGLCSDTSSVLTTLGIQIHLTNLFYWDFLLLSFLIHQTSCKVDSSDLGEFDPMHYSCGGQIFLLLELMICILSTALFHLFWLKKLLLGNSTWPHFYDLIPLSLRVSIGCILTLSII